MRKMKQALNLKKLYTKINWDRKEKKLLLEPKWMPQVVRVIESGDMIKNSDKETKNAVKKENKKKKNNIGSIKIEMSRKYYKRLKTKKAYMQQVVNESIKQES